MRRPSSFPISSFLDTSDSAGDLHSLRIFNPGEHPLISVLGESTLDRTVFRLLPFLTFHPNTDGDRIDVPIFTRT